MAYIYEYKLYLISRGESNDRKIIFDNRTKGITDGLSEINLFLLF